jgi:putative ABC transport system permease protein
MRDVRFAFRSLARRPGLILLVVLSLGLGIGGNTAMFSLLDQVLLRSLPVASPDELVAILAPEDLKGGRQSADNSGDIDAIFSYPMLRALEKDPRGLTGIAAFRNVGGNLSLDGKTQSGSVAMVSGSYFGVLGVRPHIGRLIEPEDDQGAGRAVTVLSYGYWQSKLGGDPSILNRVLRINGDAFTVAGIAPKGFMGTTLGSNPDVYVPVIEKAAITPGWDGRDKWDDYWLYLFGRIRPGFSREQARAALTSVYSGLIAEQAKTITGRDAGYVKRFREQQLRFEDGRQGRSSVRGELKTPLLLLIAVTALVLLIAAANAANLLLARGAERQKELAIRVSIGATQRAIVRQLLVEALVLAAAGALVGLLIGSWTLHLLVAAATQDDTASAYLSTQLDSHMLLFTLIVSTVIGLLFGLYPAWSAARESMAGTLKNEAGYATGSQARVRVRRTIVGAQVGISLALLIPMGLFLKSMVNVLHVNLGLRTENVLTFGISPSLNKYSPEQCRILFERAEQQLATIPGVRSVTAATVPLIAGSNWGNNLTVEGYPARPDETTHSRFNQIAPGFFGKMGVPLIAGREFRDSDTLATAQVAVVNQQFANHFFGNTNPIGRKFGMGAGPKTKLDMEIVGVVADSKYSDIKKQTPRVYFTPYRQSKELGSIALYVRTSLAPELVAPEVRKVMASLDRDLPLEDFRTFDEQVSRMMQSDRLVLQLSAAFAALATLLAMMGLYGVMAYTVTRRTREIGIRMALGAQTGRIRGMVMREVLRVLAFGILLGVPVAFLLGRFAESELYGVKAYDALVGAGAVLAVLIAGLAAGYLPARKASLLNPTQALRYE